VRPANITGTAQFSFSDNGSLVYIPGAADPAEQRTLALVDRQGVHKPLALPPGAYGIPRIAPNGKTVAFSSEEGNEQVVLIHELSGNSAPRRLTFGGNNLVPVWSADGERIAFRSTREGDPGIFWQRADGTGTAECLTKSEVALHTPESSKASAYGWMTNSTNDYIILRTQSVS
jgi:Tol biopolymer transport system component